METLEDLPPRSSNPPPLPLFEHIEQLKTQHTRFDLSESLEHPPHQPSLVEQMAYLYARPSIFPQDQPHSTPLLFHPIHNDIHGPLFDEPSHNHHDQQESPQEHSQHFESLFPSYEEIESSIWDISPNTQNDLNTRLSHLKTFKHMVDSHLNHVVDFQMALYSSIVGNQNSSQPSTFAPPSMSHPPTNEIPPPPNFPRHECGHCERTAHISERCQRDIRELTYEMRFILNHILERLNAISHPPQA